MTLEYTRFGKVLPPSTQMLQNHVPSFGYFIQLPIRCMRENMAFANVFSLRNPVCTNGFFLFI